MESLLPQVIQSVQQSEISYCKYLSANDTKLTKAHQSGYLISKSAWSMFLENQPEKGSNIKVNITINWQNDFETDSIFTYYGAAKDEFRITNFGRNFPYREDENVGDLFVLSRVKGNYYKAFILSYDDEIEEFFASVNISSVETNTIIPNQFQVSAESRLYQCFIEFLKSLNVDFPPAIDLATNARNCFRAAFGTSSVPDKELLNWLDAEFQLFKIIENDRYHNRISTPFETVEELVECANTILNRRKSRAGKSLEHHLAEIFTLNNLKFKAQALTEDKKKPDFLFPGTEEYLNPAFNEKKLIVLASKTTCKDRWRQVLNEADRIKTKHLFTLQQGISLNQLEEMYKYNVCLIVPEPYLKSFPSAFQGRIITLGNFVNHVQSIQV